MRCVYLSRSSFSRGLLVAAAAVWLWGCGSGDGRDSSDRLPIIGTTWVAEEIDGRPLDRPHPSLRFEPDGRVTGSGGCNDFSASFGLTGDRIDLRQVTPTTATACPSPVLANERRFLSALELVRQARVNDAGFLILSGQAGPQIRFFANRT